MSEEQEEHHFSQLNRFDEWTRDPDEPLPPVTVTVRETYGGGYRINSPGQNGLKMDARDMLLVYGWCVQHIDELEKKAKQEEQEEAEILGRYSREANADVSLEDFEEDDDTEDDAAEYEWCEEELEEEEEE